MTHHPSAACRPSPPGPPASPDELARVQQRMASAPLPPLAIEDVPIAQSIGRVLAETLAPRGRGLDAGVRLQERDVPALAATGRPTVRVHARLKVGILTLAPLPEERVPGAPDPALAGPMAAALVEGLGARAIAAPPVQGDLAAVCAVLDMLLGACPVVLVVGHVTTSRLAQVELLLRARGADVSEPLLCPDLGSRLLVGRLHDRVVLSLPPGLGHAFMACTLLVSPLVRRWQGRVARLPRTRTARLRPVAGGAGSYMWAREIEASADLALQSQAGTDPIDAIATSDGIARTITGGSVGEDVEVDYYPYATWLR